MRLFHTNFTLTGKKLTINEDRVLKHAKVLRLWIWDEIAVQDTLDDVTIRYICKIEEVHNKQLVCEVMSSSQQKKTMKPWMLVGIPNTQDKLHLMVQKLTEIWMHEIVFRRNDRSTGQDINVKKMSKLCKIWQESIEQSNGRFLPKISQIDNIHERVVDKELVLFDFDGDAPRVLQWNPVDRMYGVVWPEWHFSPRDYETIWFQIVHKISLWDTILRTETAAIVWAWILQNLT